MEQGKRYVFYLPFIIFPLLAFSPPNQSIWMTYHEGIHETQTTLIYIHPRKVSTLFIATDKALYIREGSSPAQAVYYLQSAQVIHDVFIPLNSPSNIFLATSNGLYLSQDLGMNWQRIFSGSVDERRNVYSVIDGKDEIYAATDDGLYEKRNFQSIWRKVQGAGHEPIYQLERNHQHLFFVTANALSRRDLFTGNVEKIFSLTKAEEQGRSVIDVQVSGTSPQTICILTVKGVFQSTAEGDEWERVDTGILPLGELNRLAIISQDENEMLAVASQKGVYLQKNDRWVSLYKGMESSVVHDLVMGTDQTLYTATARGLFFMQLPKAFASGDAFTKIKMDYHEMTQRFSYEPSIREVQSMAIDYAEVHPEKIQNWRRAARLKAVLPDLSVGVERAASDLFHWDTGQSPDVLQTGRDYIDWDVSVSWDLSELIWNNDQTSIDSRSKLMVELREDILDQITRLYFERRRVQFELLQEDGHPQEMFDKQMRVEELTALLDSFTGGKFSTAIKGHKDTKTQGHMLGGHI